MKPSHVSRRHPPYVTTPVGWIRRRRRTTSSDVCNVAKVLAYALCSRGVAGEDGIRQVLRAVQNQLVNAKLLVQCAENGRYPLLPYQRRNARDGQSAHIDDVQMSNGRASSLHLELGLHSGGGEIVVQESRVYNSSTRTK